MSQRAKLLGAAALLIGQVALQIGGYQNTWLSGILIFATVVLVVFWLIDAIRHFLARRTSRQSTAWEGS